MIFVLLALAWLVLVLLGLTMCRVGALSDRLHASALAEWIATRPTEQETLPAEYAANRLPYRTRRAAG